MRKSAEDYLAEAYRSVDANKSADLILSGGELSSVQQGLALMAIKAAIADNPPWPSAIDVRRLKLGPRDLLVVSTPKALDVPTIQILNGTVREALDDAGHPETKVLILTEGTSLGVLEPEAEPQG